MGDAAWPQILATVKESSRKSKWSVCHVWNAGWHCTP